MRFAHISDLHLGKRLHEVSFLEDQSHVLNEICEILRDEKPDAVLIAGDIYDKSMPSAEAVRLFDDFLSELSADGQKVFVISGLWRAHHGEERRLSFRARISRGGLFGAFGG